MTTPYAQQVRERYLNHANPELAKPMENYMRNQFPFLGIKTPEREAILKEYLHEHGQPTSEQFDQVILDLWAMPEREFQNVAMSLLERYTKKAEADHIVLIEQLITTNSWWDTVDMLAGKLVGRLFHRFPELIPEYTERWMDSGNIWLIRSAILFQLGYKQKTDTQLLFDMIRRSNDSKEFFINKAIGWALRQYAKTDAQAVVEFVEATPLAPLSVREALKHIKR